MLNRYYLIDIIGGFFGNIDDSDFPLFCQLCDLRRTVVSYLLYAGMNLILSTRYPIIPGYIPVLCVYEELSIGRKITKLQCASLYLLLTPARSSVMQMC